MDLRLFQPRQRGPSERTTLNEADRLEAEGRILEAIDALTEANRASRSVKVERRLVNLRHRGFAELGGATAPPSFEAVNMRHEAMPEDDGLPAVAAAQLDPAVIQAGILRYGSVIVRDLVDRAEAERLAAGIDRVFEDRDAHAAGAASSDRTWFEPFLPDAEFARAVGMGRTFVNRGSGTWLADSPRMLFDLIETFEAAGLRSTVTGYLGERPAISVNKATLRRAAPTVSTEWWHQDGAFLGEGIRALNVWLALTDCGRDAPGMDVVARRLDGVVESGTEDADFGWSVGRQLVDRVSDGRISRPVFRAGDALLFDHLCLHKTAAAEDMTKTRYATETWFFAPSAYPDPQRQVPLVF